MTSSYDWLDSALTTLHKAGWHRSPRLITSAPGPTLDIEGLTLLNFSSNDYLGLANDPRLKAAAIEAIQTHGTGTTGSRLVTGSRILHKELERQIAQLKKTKDALVFSSGYSANVGTIAALMGKRDLVLNDQYNHSSLRSGATLSGATCLDYQHCNLNDLRQTLTNHRDRFAKCLILTDSVFSMDGDLAPLSELLDLAEEFDCMMLVDEAHATGVLGESGAGGLEACGCTGRSVIQMGTLSKALGSLGGYVAGSEALIDFLRNRAPSWIYTTALSPADTAAAIAALQVIQIEPDRRSQLIADFQQPKPFQRLINQAINQSIRGGSPMPLSTREMLINNVTRIVTTALKNPDWESSIYGSRSDYDVLSQSFCHAQGLSQRQAQIAATQLQGYQLYATCWMESGLPSQLIRDLRIAKYMRNPQPSLQPPTIAPVPESSARATAKPVVKSAAKSTVKTQR